MSRLEWFRRRDVYKRQPQTVLAVVKSHAVEVALGVEHDSLRINVGAIVEGEIVKRGFFPCATGGGELVSRAPAVGPAFDSGSVKVTGCIYCQRTIGARRPVVGVVEAVDDGLSPSATGTCLLYTSTNCSSLKQFT